MRRLILFRHGEAEPPTASGRDRDRALTSKGRADARAAGEALRVAGVRVDAALVSDSRRTRETWAAAAAVLGAAPETVSAELYDASADALLAAARACVEAQAVAVVAHNPGLQLLVARLSGEDGPFPPAAVAVFDMEGAEPRLVLRRPSVEAVA